MKFLNAFQGVDSNGKKVVGQGVDSNGKKVVGQGVVNKVIPQGTGQGVVKNVESHRPTMWNLTDRTPE